MNFNSFEGVFIAGFRRSAGSGFHSSAVPYWDISTLTPALSTVTPQGARSIHCGNNAQNYAQIQYTPKITSARMKLAML